MNTTPETLILYYSQTGATEKVALELQKQTGADIERFDVAEVYDVIFLAYPIWFGTYAPPVMSLLKNVKLEGKKIVPICTFGSRTVPGGVDYLFTVRHSTLSDIPILMDLYRESREIMLSSTLVRTASQSAGMSCHSSINLGFAPSSKKEGVD